MEQKTTMKGLAGIILIIAAIIGVLYSFPIFLLSGQSFGGPASTSDFILGKIAAAVLFIVSFYTYHFGKKLRRPENSPKLHDSISGILLIFIGTCIGIIALIVFLLLLRMGLSISLFSWCFILSAISFLLISFGVRLRRKAFAEILK